MADLSVKLKMTKTLVVRESDAKGLLLIAVMADKNLALATVVDPDEFGR